MHPVLALDAADGTALGLAAGRVWTRDAEKVPPRRSRSLEEKESVHWIEEGAAAKAALASARQVTPIGRATSMRNGRPYRSWAST